MVKTSLHSLNKRLKNRSCSDILKIVDLHISNAYRNILNRYHCRNYRKRPDDKWVRLLGADETGEHVRFLADTFYSDQTAVFPRPLHEGRVAIENLEFIVGKARNHCFDLLGSGFLNADSTAIDDEELSSYLKRKELISSALSQTGATPSLIEYLHHYRLIDWHKDFKSGYRWSSDDWYFTIHPGTVPGTDIKVPWELSRFYHAGPMGLFWQETHDLTTCNEFQMQISDWIISNPLYYGVNWRNAMEAGLRASNWLLGVGYFRNNRALTPDFLWIFHKSIYEHAHFILNNLEKNSFGANNHYLGNILGLISIGAAFPWIPSSDYWLLFGIQELIKEMNRQVHPDGTHFEASTSYHRFAAEILFACFLIVTSIPEERRKRLVRQSYSPTRKIHSNQKPEYNFERSEVFPEWFIDRLFMMMQFIKDISKPGDDLPQIGDNDSGRVFWLPLPFVSEGGSPQWKLNAHQDFLALVDNVLSHRVSLNKAAAFSTSETSAGNNKFPNNNAVLYQNFGIAVFRKEPLRLTVSCGRNGGNGEGGHAHNDKLSFELSLNGMDFIVDPGTYLYTSHAIERNRFRSTRAHNTVLFPGLEQNPISSDNLFRLQDKANAKILHFDHASFFGMHIGYGFVCEREFQLDVNGLFIKDWSKIPGGLIIFNLHPNVEYKDSSLYRDDMVIRLRFNGIRDIRLEPTLYSPRYGIKVDSLRLIGQRTGVFSMTHFSY